ncbi:hypothetical protein [Saccharomonospora piscinae]|uniref:hypothetical protein n=1 Tax=Saccharomonospora piscinae TaxID=687388 RepID=UPI001FCA4742|nr:hypothetical protein [Saccharomonospora piscinae]
MSAAKVDTPLSWDDLVRIWCELDVPEGWRPETANDGTYRQACRVAFGKDVRLAEPFGVVLGTAAF